MDAALQKNWTRESFFAWAEAQDGRHEFDGVRPVAITGGSNIHAMIQGNLITALRAALRGSGCRVLGPDAGLATIGDAVRYPEALITCANVTGADRTVPGVVVVFEMLGALNNRTVKLHEYAAVASIRRYVMVDSEGAGVLVLYRQGGGDPWTVFALLEDDTLALPEVGIRIPVAALYEDVDFPEFGATGQ